jgi:ADP-ribose pyrophosphatase YjhB (NUDIX family)
MIEDFSGGLVTRGKKVLMFFDEEQDFWTVPSGKRESRELSADAATRVTEDMTGCSSEVLKYQGKFKTTFEMQGEEVTWQPYMMEIDGNPERGEWVDVSEIPEKKLSPPLSKIGDKLADKL